MSFPPPPFPPGMMPRRNRFPLNAQAIFSEAGPGPSTEDIEEQNARSSRGTRCELKQLDGRYDHTGNYTVSDSSVSIVGEADEADPNAEYALISTRIYGINGLYQSTQLEIRSRLIKRVLRKIVKFYPGQPVDTQELTLSDPPMVLFHYRQELEDYRFTRADEDTKKHLDLLFKFVDSLLKKQADQFKDLVKRKLITFPLLWMLFRPGDIIYTYENEQPSVFVLHKMDAVSTLFGKYWRLSCVGVDSNGERLGKIKKSIKVHNFEGTRDIPSLNVFPFKYHPEEHKTKLRLIARGKRFLELQGCHHKGYKGVAHALSDRFASERSDYELNDDIDVRDSAGAKRLWAPSTVIGRIMVDATTFSRINPPNAIKFGGNESINCECSKCRQRDIDNLAQMQNDTVPSEPVDWADSNHTLTLSEKNTMLCPPFVYGFSLQSKKWCRFFVDQIIPVELNDKAFEQLIIAPNHKELVLAMVEAHVESADSKDAFDDIISGKGKSLIILLHGAPGVGKTLTAESIADHTKRPLYMISSGELGTHPQEVEETLTNVLDIATTWKAVVLLDEADVFLQQRSGSDINRNALVSIFLRLLEYYEGILFLTSNRVESFDLAFKSRIHVALNYPELSLSIRRQLWRDFLMRMPESTRDLNIESDLDVLQIDAINGRQIKNACKTAAALARKKGEKLQLKHLRMTLSTIREFEMDFARGVEAAY